MDQLVAQQIRHDIENNTIVLYMKGTTVFPQCGCSAQVVQILGILGVKYKSVDILSNPNLRQGIKDFSNWPTIPQLYIKGEFIGDNNIVREMFEAGELQELLEQMGIIPEFAR